MLTALDYGYFGDDIILPEAQGPRWPSWLTQSSLQRAVRTLKEAKGVLLGRLGANIELYRDGNVVVSSLREDLFPASASASSNQMPPVIDMDGWILPSPPTSRVEGRFEELRFEGFSASDARARATREEHIRFLLSFVVEHHNQIAREADERRRAKAALREGRDGEDSESDADEDDVDMYDEEIIERRIRRRRSPFRLARAEAGAVPGNMPQWQATPWDGLPQGEQ